MSIQIRLEMKKTWNNAEVIEIKFSFFLIDIRNKLIKITYEQKVNTKAVDIKT